MNDRIEKALLGAAAAAATASLLSAAVWGASRALFRLATDRKTPRLVEKSKERISGSLPGLKQVMELVDKQAWRLEGMGCATVELTARDGVRLVGHWFEHPQPERIVVAMHGWRSHWAQDFGLVADFFRQNGCSVLYAEQRGQNESGGEHITFGLLERLDCIDWLNWAQRHSLPGLPVYPVGISMGATTVLLASGLGLPESVAGIIADCGFTSPHAIWQHVAENNLHLRYDLCAGWVQRLCRRRLHSDLLKLSTTEALKQCKKPVLLVHGTEDSFVPISMTYENYLACPGLRELLVVPGAAHGMSYLVEPERYEQTVLDFWKRCENLQA